KFYLRTLNGILETEDFINVTNIAANLPANNLLMDIYVSDNYVYAVTDKDVYRYKTEEGTIDISKVSYDKSNFKIYPNPSSEIICIQANEIIHNGKAQLFDLSGKLVLEQKMTGNTMFIETKGIASGIYVIKISDGQITSSQRVVIQNN